ncbi:hypothetical protein FA314_32645 [Pseudomonas aeruginosa]|uniref:hypothetical protein n=1 Tax=Burkholderia multivorans TaxID=87883 RepID=UPI001C228597|nr:hypothetical protein [Burkholderia multivorans]MBU9224625.1 hypothetical protein [Burkholderia multivorans]MBU9418100.1 hypothetical protein [Burkholderia multivorans]MBU9479602.1 hypothetical protein [Burkholderia multivorans]MCO2636831.1 hypothetical protein [Pseudomonas aeruginosa]
MRFDTAEVGGLYNVSPEFQLGLGYSYTRANIRAIGSKTNIHKISLGGIYSLEKRTQLYATGTFEKMSGVGLGLNAGTGAFENYAQLAYLGNSSSPNQLGFRSVSSTIFNFLIVDCLESEFFDKDSAGVNFGSAYADAQHCAVSRA